MRILVTNDDGYDAPGLAAMVRVAASLGDVLVLAPAEEQSYMGHRVTVGTLLRPVEYAPGRFHLNGTPADCVRVASRALEWDASLVLAGVNRGGNLGADIYTSGTVAAAREAALLGYPAIAVSQYVHAGHAVDWTRTEAMATRVLGRLLAQGVKEPGTYWNVNLPHPDEQLGIELCAPDPQPLDVRFVAEEGGYRYGGRYRDRPSTSGRDVERCFAGYITVSRLHLSPTY